MPKIVTGTLTWPSIEPEMATAHGDRPANRPEQTNFPPLLVLAQRTNDIFRRATGGSGSPTGASLSGA
jgi:hypothetical protein